MFGRKNPAPAKKAYNKEEQEPALRCSICTGEKTAGFRDLKSGKFTDVMLIADDGDLRRFMDTYGIESAEDIKKIY